MRNYQTRLESLTGMKLDTFKKLKQAGVCDKCGSKDFTRRADDKAETVTTRLMAYYRETAPLIGYYFAKGTLKTVDGMEPIDVVGQRIEKILASAK